MEKNIPNLIGEKFGHWKVVELDRSKTIQNGKSYWLCACDCGCGLIKSIRIDSLKNTKIGGCNNNFALKPKQCLKCGKFFYPKKQAKTRKYCYFCAPETENKTSLLRQNLKKWALEYKGEKCKYCGYDKCNEALEFHHINPNEKDFSISDRNLTADWEEIKEELDKCVLVCSNCHREIHAGVRIVKGDDNKNA